MNIEKKFICLLIIFFGPCLSLAYENILVEESVNQHYQQENNEAVRSAAMSAAGVLRKLEESKMLREELRSLMNEGSPAYVYKCSSTQLFIFFGIQWADCYLVEILDKGRTVLYQRYDGLRIIAAYGAAILQTERTEGVKASELPSKIGSSIFGVVTIGPGFEMKAIEQRGFQMNLAFGLGFGAGFKFGNQTREDRELRFETTESFRQFLLRSH